MSCCQSLDALSTAQSVTNAFGGRAPSGQLQRSPEPLAAIGGAVLLLSGYEERGSSAQSRAVVH